MTVDSTQNASGRSTPTTDGDGPGNMEGPARRTVAAKAEGLTVVAPRVSDLNILEEKLKKYILIKHAIFSLSF